MPLMPEINIEDPRYERANRQASQYTRALESHRASHRNYEESIAEAKAVREKAASVVEAAMEKFNQLTGDEEATEAERRFISNELQGILPRITQTIDSSERSQRRLSSSIDTLLGQAAEAREKLEKVEKFKDGYTLKKSELKQRIGQLENVVPGSVAVGTYKGDPMLRWNFTGIILVPDRNPYGWLCNGGKVEIPLQDIAMRVSLRTGSVTAAPKRGERDLCTSRWGGSRRVHPHILSGDSPCLGDWAGVIREATEDKDWEVLVGTLRMYMSQATHEDAAGRQWTQFIENVGRRRMQEIGYGWRGLGSHLTGARFTAEMDEPQRKWFKIDKIEGINAYDTKLIEITDEESDELSTRGQGRLI